MATNESGRYVYIGKIGSDPGDPKNWKWVGKGPPAKLGASAPAAQEPTVSSQAVPGVNPDSVQQFLGMLSSGHKNAVGMLRPAVNAAAPARQWMFGGEPDVLGLLSGGHAALMRKLQEMNSDYTTHNRLMRFLGQPQWQRGMLNPIRGYGGGQAINPALWE